MKVRFKENRRLYIGLIITGLMLILAITGKFFTPYDPNAMDSANKLAGISAKHIMGCDNFGRDIFSRILAGLDTTMAVAVGTVLIGATFGTVIGALTGYYGGRPDEIMMRFNDAVLAFPSLLLALVIISIMGSGKMNVTIALGILFIPGYARIVRGEFLKCRNLDYVQSARLMGASDLRIMFVHILPNIIPVLLSTVAIGFNNAVLAEAGMSFLGIGVQPPDSSLGRMLSESQSYLFLRPGYALCTGSVIALLIFGFAMLNEGLEKHA